jgi:hypothetical protein
MINQQFYDWSVVKEALKEELTTKHRGKYYWCRCKCGTMAIVRSDQLKSGRSKGCKECYSKKFKKNVTKHNMHLTSTYQIWRGIKKRCRLKSHPSYRWYGAKGITYDPKWEDFKGFLEDMGERPGNFTIDRIDSDLGYYKNNCRWVSMQDNLDNRKWS